MTDVPDCRNCAHAFTYRPRGRRTKHDWFCGHSTKVVSRYASGKVLARSSRTVGSARATRWWWFLDLCGPKGRFFEQENV